MAEMTVKAALAALQPFEAALAAARSVLEAADRAETAEANALGRTQDAERRIAQAMLRVAKSEEDAETRIREAEARVQKAEETLKVRLGETKRTLEGQVAILSDEVQAERHRLEQATQARAQAERDLKVALEAAKDLEGIRADIQRAAAQRARLETDLSDLSRRIESSQAAYEDISKKIAAFAPKA